MSVEKYSLTTNTWTKVNGMYEKHYSFCACVFIYRIFIISVLNTIKISYRPQFDTRYSRWEEVARMNYARSVSALWILKEML